MKKKRIASIVLEGVGNGWEFELLARGGDVVGVTYTFS